MRTLRKVTAILASAAMSAAALLPAPVRAAELSPASATFGSWASATLSRDSADWRIEAYKVDRNLVAWTEVNEALSQRRLFAYDGAKTTMLAALAKGDWNDAADAGFYDPVRGSFDAADGLVVWVGSDGIDREIWSFDGEAVRKVSDNTYDDKHPVTSAGRIAWTSVPGSAYNLMVKDKNGTYRLDGWHVLNYAFSGKNLYWTNKLSHENWFRVFVNDGIVTRAVGEGDDRPVRDYFLTDGKGTAAWEYSTKRWDYDKRVVYLSQEGAQAIRMIQRDVPPNITRLEDVDGGKVMLNVTDLLYTKLHERVSLIEVSGGMEKTLRNKPAPGKVRYMDGGYVRHIVHENASALHFVGAGREDFVSLDPVLHDRFDADGDAAAAARAGGGLVAFVVGQPTLISTVAEVEDVDVKNGDIAWIEGKPGSAMLRYATRHVLVKSGTGAKTVHGYLAKSADHPAVYLVAKDGKRYVFPSEKQFFDWYDGFRSVRTVSKAALASHQLGGNVLLRPGAHLVKSPSSPRVYIVASSGEIRWVTDGRILAERYGERWTTLIDVLDDTLIADYAVGAPISDRGAFYAAIAR